MSDFKSAPTKPGVNSLNFSKLTKGLIRTFLHIRSNIALRDCLSGIPRQTSRSNRPARLNAGSKLSGRLVAPITITFASSFKPYNIYKICNLSIV